MFCHAGPGPSLAGKLLSVVGGGFGDECVIGVDGAGDSGGGMQ